MRPRILLSREVPVGNVVFGGRNPIVRQTMTVSATDDTEGIYREISMLAESGAQLIRVTVQGAKVAASLEPLRKLMDSAGITVPLAADIHYSPEAALLAADYVAKVRINPGNFSENRKHDFEEISDEDYQAELSRITGEFTPLLEKCKRLGRAIRIGTNHGSLSPRALNRFGDTPRGMVESALEFVRMAEAADFHDIVLSMKSSHVRVMIDAYRLLALEMLRRSEKEGLPVYPVHLGVTEAGVGEDARFKSYIGMASLLEMGIGDTVRVSLTEPPMRELPATRALAERYSDRRLLAEPWLGANMSIHLQACGADPVTGALPMEEALFGVGPEALAAQYPITLVPVHWQPAIQELLCLPWEPAAPDHVRNDGHEQPATVQIARGAAVRLAEPKLESEARERTYLELAVGVGVPLLEGRARRIAVMASTPEEALHGTELAYTLLQTTRLRMSRADFISCPSCGRTLFDIEEVTDQIRRRFGHLRGVKIAVMGCIVNGPGEMADADFGYVGAGPGKVDLYVGRRCLEKNISSESAVNRLQLLMESCGAWEEPALLD